MAKANKQKILEAKANLDAAKMLESIKAISERRKELEGYKYRLDDSIETLERTTGFLKAFKSFKANSNCVGKEINFINDIVDGIKTKAKYEIEKKELEQKLEIARKSYASVVNENKIIKTKLVGFMENYIDEKLDKAEINKFISNTKSLDDVIAENFKEVVTNTCSTDEIPW